MGRQGKQLLLPLLEGVGSSCLGQASSGGAAPLESQVSSWLQNPRQHTQVPWADLPSLSASSDHQPPSPSWVLLAAPLLVGSSHSGDSASRQPVWEAVHSPWLCWGPREAPPSPVPGSSPLRGLLCCWLPARVSRSVVLPLRASVQVWASSCCSAAQCRAVGLKPECVSLPGGWVKPRVLLPSPLQKL